MDPGFKFRYIDIGSVGKNGQIDIPEENVPFGDAPSRARRLAYPGDTIVSTVRTYLRAVASVPESEEPLVFSTGFSVLGAGSNIDPKFLSYSCLSNKFIDEVVARSVGVSYPAVSASDVGNIRIRVPGLAEQRRIADFLDAEVARMDGVCERRLKISVLAGQRHRALIDLEFDRLSVEYGTRHFRRFVLHVEQGVSPLCENRPAPDGEWGVLKVSAVKLGVFDSEENKFYSEGLSGAGRYEVREGDILITRANTPSLVGSVALVPKVRKKLIISDKIFRIHLSGGLDPAFLAFIAGGSRIRGLCAADSHGTSQSMVNLKSENIKAWPIPAAPISEQVNVSKKLEESRVFTDRMQGLAEQQIDLLEERKRALITAAVTGQIDVTTARGADLS